MVTDIYQFCVVLIPLVAGGAILNLVSTAVMTKAVSVKDTGAMLGVAMSTNSVIRSVSPFLGGLMFQHYSWPSIGALGFVVNALVAVFLFVRTKDSLPK